MAPGGRPVKDALGFSAAVSLTAALWGPTGEISSIFQLLVAIFVASMDLKGEVWLWSQQ